MRYYRSLEEFKRSLKPVKPFPTFVSPKIHEEVLEEYEKRYGRRPEPAELRRATARKILNVCSSLAREIEREYRAVETHLRRYASGEARARERLEAAARRLRRKIRRFIRSGCAPGVNVRRVLSPLDRFIEGDYAAIVDVDIYTVKPLMSAWGYLRAALKEEVGGE
ncbi:MAG: hypothetical protein DRJ67_01505 [Thermoprotei archaeon]|nr:MAG: hypothetical protein DRJ67_01505 [Thermoprotei archaeon]